LAKSEGYGQGSNMRVAPPSQLPEITEMLLDRGYGEEDVRKVMAGISAASPPRLEISAKHRPGFWAPVVGACRGFYSRHIGTVQ